MTDLNPTTRSYPRTTREAFPAEYAVIEHYKRRTNYFSVVVILLIVGIIAISI